MSETVVKSSDKEQFKEQDNLTLIFNSSPVGMIILNGDATISDINNAALNFIEKNNDEVIGSLFGNAFDCLGSYEDARGCGFGSSCLLCVFRKAVTKAIESGTTTESLEFNKVFIKAGEHAEMWFRSSIIPICQNNKRKIFVSLVDITDSKQKEFSAIKDKQTAEAATRVKSEFLANMSHEIRTPLNGAIGMIDLTLMTELNSEQKENLETAKSCAISLLNIINDILDFSKLEANKLIIETLEFDLKYLIEETIKAHSSMANSKGLELNYSFSSNVPQFLIGDPNRLKQIFNNLISNAVKFTEKGSVSVIVKNRNSTSEYADLQFIVSDTGIGISKDDMGKLFQTFSQVDGSITRKFGGTGLGLAISNQLVKLMGGTIWAESEKGRGSNFYLNLRFKASAQTRKEESQVLSIDKTADPMNILLAEDNFISQRILSRMLKEKGHSVDVASNGLEAIKLYASNMYDLILMDIYMPEMDGIEATKRIREREGSERHTPIIAVTAEVLHKERDHFLTLGMDEYLPKPIKMDILFETLERIHEKKMKGLEAGMEKRKPENKDETVSKDQNLLLVNDLADMISALGDGILRNDLAVIEASAHKIKNLANEIDAEEIKGTAFRVELSAKRGNLLEVADYAKQIEYEYQTLKKTLNL